MRSIALYEVWSKRFIYATLFHISVLAIWTSLIIVPSLNIPKIITGGSAGTWYVIGYEMYLMAGVIGSAMLAFLYYLVPRFGTKEIKSSLALLNFTLVQIGVLLSSFLLGYAGYVAGSMRLAEEPTSQIHEFLVNFINPAGIGVIIAVLGFLIGTIALSLSLKKSKE